MLLFCTLVSLQEVHIKCHDTGTVRLVYLSDRGDYALGSQIQELL